MIRGLTRRRFLAISAGLAAAPGAALSATASWRGTALGAEASITLGGLGRAASAQVFAEVRQEVSRLEDVFSLYRDASEISRLNRHGHLEAPSPDLVALLRDCAAIHRATRGAFDPTVQALWRALARGGQRAEAQARLGWRNVALDDGRISFARPGMRITLNGIAQGYITDRIAALLRTRGFRDVLVDIGEIAAIGANHGQPWSAGIAAPEGRVVQRVTLRDRCLAVSAPAGTPLRGGPHILSPFPGAAGPAHRLVAVTAPLAAIADGLSTGCCLLGARDAKSAVAQFDGARLETLI